MRTNILKLVFILFLLSLTGCIPVAEFDQSAYDQAVLLKTESITLMDKASESFTLHKEEVDSLKIKVEAAYNNSQTRLNNSETTSQWRIMKDPGRSLLYGFLEMWEQKDHINSVFIVKAELIVGDAFDTIINLELDKKNNNGGVK
jgi:hypothetical protein